VSKAARSFASIVVVGPRQSGKTTLVRRRIGATHSFWSLDEPSVVAQARTDRSVDAVPLGAF
jgi:molybdopterin-guanine dinucleotide biosynthesis protein